MTDKIPPAPWRVDDMGDDDWCVADATGRYIPGLEHFHGDKARAVAERIVVEHNAFDIMSRRGWSVSSQWSNLSGFSIEGWFVVDEHGNKLNNHYVCYHSPSMAVVAAEKWYVEKN